MPDLTYWLDNLLQSIQQLTADYTILWSYNMSTRIRFVNILSVNAR